MKKKTIKKRAANLLLIAFIGFTGFAVSAPAAGASGGMTVPPATNPAPVEELPVITPRREAILKVARRERRFKVRERRGDNIPRYRRGGRKRRGRIAPYNIRDQWCAAFATWVWAQVGYTDFRNPVVIEEENKKNKGTKKTRTLRPLRRTLWPAQDKSLVAVQVKALRNWASLTNRRTFRATPGDLIAYGDNHIGIVISVNRKKRLVRTIEGNYKNGVRARTIAMSDTIDYFTPSPLPLRKRVISPRSVAADIEFDRNSPYRPAITPVDPSTLVE